MERFVVQLLADVTGRQPMRWRLKSRFLAMNPLGMTKLKPLGMTRSFLATKNAAWRGRVRFSYYQIGISHSNRVNGHFCRNIFAVESER